MTYLCLVSFERKSTSHAPIARTRNMCRNPGRIGTAQPKKRAREKREPVRGFSCATRGRKKPAKREKCERHLAKRKETMDNEMRLYGNKTGCNQSRLICRDSRPNVICKKRKQYSCKQRKKRAVDNYSERKNSKRRNESGRPGARKTSGARTPSTGETNPLPLARLRASSKYPIASPEQAHRSRCCVPRAQENRAGAKLLRQ